MSLRPFFKNDSGAVGVAFILILVPLMGVVALASDYAAASRYRQGFNVAADAAALVAVSASLRAQDKSVAQAQADKAFRNNLDADLSSALTALNVQISDLNGERTAVVSYSATYAGGFGQSFGLPNMSVANTVTARGPAATYIDFYMLLDNSPSMGLAATQADIDTMNTALGCAFACHQLDLATDAYAQAKSLGVKMRIDVVRSATQQLTDTASTSQIVPGQYRMGIYTFGSKAETAKLTEISPLTTSLSYVKSAANAVDLMTIPYNMAGGDALTDYAANLNALNMKVGTPGTGRAGDLPQKVVFFVTDGLNNSEKASCSQLAVTVWDQLNSRNINRCQEPISPALCNQFKARGVKVAVLYTTYLPLPENQWYLDYVGPYISQVSPAMKACASDGLFFEVSPTQGIGDAMQALFLKTITNASLTK